MINVTGGSLSAAGTLEGAVLPDGLNLCHLLSTAPNDALPSSPSH